MIYNVAVASMKMLGALGYAGQLDALGISRADYLRLVGDAPWIGTDRNRMVSMLSSLGQGTIDALGLPRIKVSAEYTAAVITTFVSPVNIHTACVYMASAPEVEAMGRNVSAPNVTPDQLFALVQQLYGSEDRSSVRQLFEKRVGIDINDAKMVLSNKQK